MGSYNLTAFFFLIMPFFLLLLPNSLLTYNLTHFFFLIISYFFCYYPLLYSLAWDYSSQSR